MSFWHAFSLHYTLILSLSGKTEWRPKTCTVSCADQQAKITSRLIIERNNYALNSSINITVRNVSHINLLQYSLEVVDAQLESPSWHFRVFVKRVLVTWHAAPAKVVRSKQRFPKTDSNSYLRPIKFKTTQPINIDIELLILWARSRNTLGKLTQCARCWRLHICVSAETSCSPNTRPGTRPGRAGSGRNIYVRSNNAVWSIYVLRGSADENKFLLRSKTSNSLKFAAKGKFQSKSLTNFWMANYRRKQREKSEDVRSRNVKSSFSVFIGHDGWSS